ncbi:single-stranded DNA-binding protein [Actinomycetospora soli]|uniref:single-stranded DNA-binding protein n=1 Tax=Actinomycetospora soli TaxID=2893887 RepID=UPI001E43E57A|nr:single-stranded DNA-binding protein [Actinomycetospora soli]MCD2191750.1 single-stranded DNA-binding protein [Actinomycetospora soli]
MNETWVTVTGNVATDVTWRRGATGSVANFFLMSNERKFDGQSGAWRDGDRLGIRVTCWRGLAENVRMSVTKGDPVVVHGRLYTSEYEQEGVRRTSTQIEAKSVGLDLRKVCARVVIIQESGPDDGRGPVDVSDLVVVPDELTAPGFTGVDVPSGDGPLEVDDDELPGREALAS